MRVGIVGAGLNSDYHITFAKAHPRAHIVGIADAERSRAEAAARKHAVEGAYGSVAELLNKAAPDVVHVVTPPRTHFGVVEQVLAARRHVLVEKPLALNVGEATALYDLAAQQRVQLCPVHNHLFDPCMQQADALVKSGVLGDVINVESYYGLNTRIPAFRDYPRPNVLPWLYGLPGGVYQDFLPHPIYVLLEYVGAPRALTLLHRVTGELPQELPDEIRVLVNGERALGSLTVSFAAKPHLHYVRIYGTRMMVEVDFNTMTTVAHPVGSLPKAAQKVVYNLSDGSQRARATVSNVWRFVRGSLKPYHGMLNLIHAYYDALLDGRPAPVAREKALAVVRTMDTVFEQLKHAPLRHERINVSARPAPGRARTVLVTGGTGFLGRPLVSRLLAEGNRVRVLARKLSRVDAVAAMGAEVYWGDVADAESFGEAFAGCDVVVHLAAGTSGTDKDCETATLQGTRNLLDLCRRHRPQKLVYISSCSVYGIANRRRGDTITEDSPLERLPERRGAYSASKQAAERLVTEYMDSSDVPVVVLRPGTIYGPGGDIYTPMMGFAAGRLHVVIASRGFRLPFVFVDNIVDAIVRTLDADEANGQAFNVVDPEPLTKRRYVESVVRRSRPDARVAYFPYALLYAITWAQEVAFGLLKRNPPLTRYRLRSSQMPIVYNSGKLARLLGWSAPVPLAQALERVVSSGPHAVAPAAEQPREFAGTSVV